MTGRKQPKGGSWKGWFPPEGLSGKPKTAKNRGGPKPDGYQILGKITRRILGMKDED
jgi:hypothetical protein